LFKFSGKIYGYSRFLAEVNYLVKEMQVRLQEQFDWYGRCPTKIQLVVNFVQGVKTRTIPLVNETLYNPDDMIQLLRRSRLPVNCGVVRLKLSAMKFEIGVIRGNRCY